METPVARKAINTIKDSIAGMRWRIQPRPGRAAGLPDIESRTQTLTENFDAPNPDDSFRSMAEQVLEDHVRNIAAFPLAIPLMAGPGAITATVLLAGRAGGDPLRLGVLLAVVAVVLALCLLVFTLAARIAMLLDSTANVVLSRLLGVLLAALAVQFVIDGVRAALAG